MSKHHRPAIAFASLLLTAFAVIGPANAAFAHDELVTSYPAAGSSVVNSPDEITLGFSAALTELDGSAVIEVIDETGNDVAQDEADVSTTFVTQHLSQEATPGLYNVRWKVVSSDGHPISGEYTYTVEGPATTPPTAAAEASPTPTPTPTENAETPTPSPSPATQTYGGTASGGGEFPPVLYLLAPILILGCGVIGVVMAGRRRHRQDREQVEHADA
ncbi:copper resistance protein CopC [uncultured Microbacterium sp.]|uniref:copper resistance CopC family protein n=1 Tax=uncultured Microbacterium sp. TaxID=191216 RepID=UPI0028DC33AD|nr:copper resistance protein CopC [uncultured Microbacterium sp.]